MSTVGNCQDILIAHPDGQCTFRRLYQSSLVSFITTFTLVGVTRLTITAQRRMTSSWLLCSTTASAKSLTEPHKHA